jgi:hypothetical protein
MAKKTRINIGENKMLLPNNQNEHLFRQEINLNDMKSRLYSGIISAFTGYYLENHSSASGQLDLDQVENMVEQAFLVYEESFNRLMGGKQ